MLIVNPKVLSLGKASIMFNKPEDVKYSGDYHGTVTFTLSVVDK